MSTASVPRILIVGGGYAGFYTAWKLEKLLRRDEAEVTIVDPLSYMTYQPFLPEVAAGSIEARHAVVAHRRHLHHTNVITAKITGFNHAKKTATVTPLSGDSWELEYDHIVVTAGAVSRTFPIKGVADQVSKPADPDADSAGATAFDRVIRYGASYRMPRAFPTC